MLVERLVLTEIKTIIIIIILAFQGCTYNLPL